MERKITIRKSVKAELAARIPALLQQALTWMHAQYPDVNFETAEYIFSAGYKRSRYFRNNRTEGKYVAPNACICTRAKLMLYDKKSLGIKNSILVVGSEIQIMCALIHELTHHAQHEKDERKGNELDTTANELKYLKEFHLKIYNKITN